MPAEHNPKPDPEPVPDDWILIDFAMVFDTHPNHEPEPFRMLHTRRGPTD